MSPTRKVNSASSELTESDLDNTSPRKVTKINKHRQQKFRDAWLKNEDYKQWLSKVPNDQYKAKCRTCNVTIIAELTVIKNHMTSKIHLRKLLSQQIISTFIKNTDEISTKAKATQAHEIKLCGFPTWTTEEDEKLIELVEPHPCLYSAHSSRNILTREYTWQGIAQELSKPVEQCKKRWRGLRHGYARSKRVGTVHKNKVGIFEKLQFLEESEDNSVMDTVTEESNIDPSIGTEQQVITDNQEYYEISVMDGPHCPQDPLKPFIKIIPKLDDEPPVKTLPKPTLLNGPKIVQYIEDPKQLEQRSQTIDKLLEKILQENTNEIDVFFKSMAASVKKLQPNLIPKVKMEVCNVIAKYEMQMHEI